MDITDLKNDSTVYLKPNNFPGKKRQSIELPNSSVASFFWGQNKTQRKIVQNT